MHEELPAPDFIPDFGKPHGVEPGGQIFLQEVLLAAIQVVHLQKEHGVVDPFFGIVVLQVKCQVLVDFEQAHFAVYHHLLKAQEGVKLSRFFKDPGSYKSANGFGLIGHGVCRGCRMRFILS